MKELWNEGEDCADSVLCISGSRLIRSGLTHSTSPGSLTEFGYTLEPDYPLLFVNAGGEALLENENPGIEIQPDIFFQGGDVMRTDETIAEGGDIPSVYQSARFGNFSYRFENLSPGEYYVDLHFAEIIYTNGPQGMRSFDVFMQEEKVLSELDIYSIVGANMALQIRDVGVSVGEDEAIVVRFEGVTGNPIVSGICIKHAIKLQASPVKSGHLICKKCSAEVEVSLALDKCMRMKFMAKYEKKIEDLKVRCQLKADECHEAWMSLTATNKQLLKITMELDNKVLENHFLEQAMEKRNAEFRDISSRYEHNKKQLTASFDRLLRKFQLMKKEHSQLSSEAYECASSIPELNTMVAAVQALVAECNELKLKLSDEQEKRKKLHNQIQEAKGNFRIFCRCRPLWKDEQSRGYATVVDFDAAKDGELGIVASGSTRKIFKFDRVYNPGESQADVFADASPMVVSVLDGYNVCIFAYGQTGTGKTYTMEGSEHNRGVNYRTLEQLFKIAEERRGTFTYDISVSVLEVYNEQIRDLLASSSTSKKLAIRQASEGVHHVPGIVEAKVDNITEVWSVLQAGNNARAIGSNNVNEHSSRSHCMLCIMVRAKNLINGECTKCKLWLVDLAGSERLAKTEAQGERLKEAQNINRSLSALDDVISALAAKSNHVPYRNSKLTHLLQDSLGDDAKTLMFLQISPSENDLSETLSSLNFASRVRGVELGPPRKQVDIGELQKMKLMKLDKSKQEMRSKDDTLRRLEETLHNLEGKAKSKDQLFRSQQEKVDKLESKIELKTKLCKHLEQQLLELSEEKKQKEEICTNLKQKVRELENKLIGRQHAESMVLQNMVKEVVEEPKIEENKQIRFLQQKIKELEENLRQQEQEGDYSAEELGQNTNERSLLREETPLNERNPNSSNRMLNRESTLLKGTDSLREIRRKRESHSNGIENNVLVSTSSLDRRLLSSDSNKTRSVDQSRAFSRLTRSTKPSISIKEHSRLTTEIRFRQSNTRFG